MSTEPLRVWRSLGFLCGGLLVWAALFLLTYIFAAIACAGGFSYAVWLGIGIVPSVLLLIAALSLGALYAIARRAERLPEPGARRIDDTRRVVARVALIVCGLGLIAIVWNILPVVLTASRC
jgi:hypothetical protein